MTIGTPRRRAGFTLIELLVVVAIIAVLIALLLPAVQAAREAARRAQCINNLVQLNVALQNYESAHEVLPPGVVNPTGPVLDVANGYKYGWMVQILPFIEQANTFKKLNFAKGVFDGENSTVRAHGISVFNCPSDGGPRASGSVAGNSYAGCHNDVEAPIDAGNKGVFFLNSHVRYEDITDGTSFTIFVGEKVRVGTESGWVSGTRSTLRNTGSAINGAFRAPSSGPGDDEETGGKAAAGADDMAAYVGGFSSRHPGGANFAFGDGSVRFLKTTMSAGVFQRLGNRADGDMISDDKF